MKNIVAESISDSKAMIRYIRNIFGKYPKEKWGDEYLPEDSILSKYIQVEFSRFDCSDDDKVKFVRLLRRRMRITEEDILKTLVKVFHKKFFFEGGSNFRLVFRAFTGHKSFCVITYNKRLFLKSQVKSIEKSIERYAVSDREEIGTKAKAVESNMSVEAKPIRVEAPNIAKISQEAGVDEPTAREAAVIAEDVFATAKKNENTITNMMISVVTSNGGQMLGLPFRMKQATSLGRKIATDAFDPKEKYQGDMEEASRNVRDAIRYTMIYPLETFTKSYFRTKAQLESRGYKEVRCKNFYSKYAEGNSQQKAVQCVYRSESGQVFELQFHTKMSAMAKEVNHPLYEKYRQVETSIQEKIILDRRMFNISSNVPDPAGVFTIQEHSEL